MTQRVTKMTLGCRGLVVVAGPGQGDYGGAGGDVAKCLGSISSSGLSSGPPSSSFLHGALRCWRIAAKTGENVDQRLIFRLI